MNHPNTAPDGLPVSAAADLAGVDDVTIRQAISRGELTPRTRYYLDPAQVTEWAQAKDAAQ